MLKRTTQKKHRGIPNIVVFSLIPYTTNIHEVAFTMSKNLNNKFILIFLQKLVLKSILPWYKVSEILTSLFQILNPDLFDPFLNIFNRWQLFFQIIWKIAGYFIFTYTNRLWNILERIFCNHIVFAFAQKQANGRIILLLFQNTIHSWQIKV